MDSQRPARIDGPRRRAGHLHINQLDRGITAGTDCALGFLRNPMRAAAFETDNLLAWILFGSGKRRQFGGAAGTNALSRGLVMRAAGTAICRDQVGRLKLNETAHRTPKWCFRRGGRHGRALGVFLAGVAGSLGSCWSGQARCRLARGDLGMANECGSLFDDDAHGLEVTEKFGIRLQFTALLNSHIPIHRSVDRYGFGPDFSFDNGVFAKCERPFRDDLTIELAVENHLCVEFDRSSEFDIAGENVL